MDTNELLLLGLLDSEAMHGYRLNEFLESRFGFVSDLKKPTAYRLLERLHARGLVARVTEREGRRPERFVYQLTPAGRERFHQLLRQQLASAEPIVYHGNVALLFCDRLPPAERRTLLARRRTAIADRHAIMRELVAAHTHGTTARFILEHDLAHLAVELEWLDQLLAHLDAEIDPTLSQTGDSRS